MGEFQIIEQPVKIGKGGFLGNYIHIRPNVVIGDFSEIRDSCFLAVGCIIGKNTQSMQYSNICCDAVIGDYCFIGMGVIFTNDSQISYPLKQGEKWEKKPPVVENYVRIGSGAILLPGIVLREGSRIGAGSVVTKSTEPGFTYIGNPAKKT